ncbi:Hypothetical protein CulFRC11_1835 [Corynebacterium ramonii]|uniref:Uncharacterized protein n=1 Tax=Corynebacterium ramonii TaxID=3026968 RepID=A0ABM5RUT6_9CORY|nr:Hypothetical protein CulFRC11_1835 [Corynebacterium ramonii FRC0011]
MFYFRCDRAAGKSRLKELLGSKDVIAHVFLDVEGFAIGSR